MCHCLFVAEIVNKLGYSFQCCLYVLDLRRKDKRKKKKNGTTKTLLCLCLTSVDQIFISFAANCTKQSPHGILIVSKNCDIILSRVIRVMFGNRKFMISCVSIAVSSSGVLVSSILIELYQNLLFTPYIC